MSGEQAAMPQVEDRATPERIARMVVEALRNCPAVGRVALFGSLASGEHDGLSDVDALVGHADRPSAAAECEEALRRAMPVRYYKPFGNDEPPAGRYWFRHESVLHWLDISFHAFQRYERVKLEGPVPGFPTEVVERWRAARSEEPSFGSRDQQRQETRPSATGWANLADGERHLAGAVVATTYATKRYLRGTIDRSAFAVATRDFRDGVAGLQAEETFAGGDLAGVVEDCLRLLAAIDNEDRGR